MVYIRPTPAFTAGRHNHNRNDEVVHKRFGWQSIKEAGDDHADQWEVVEFPAIMPESETPLWPEFWRKEELLSVKASLPIGKWNSQWLQNPTAEEGSIVKREWWRKWEGDVPGYSYIIQSYDTAFSKKKLPTILPSQLGLSSARRMANQIK